MSNDKFKPLKPLKNPNKIMLSIMFDPDAKEGRQLMVDGPFSDGVLFLGLLEMAKTTFLEWRQAQARKDSSEEGRIIVPRMMPPA